MLDALVQPDEVLSIALKAALYASSLLAAGSALFLLVHRDLDSITTQVLRRLALVSALLALPLSAALMLTQASYLGGGGLAAALNPVLLRLVAEGPLGESTWVRAAGLIMVGVLGFTAGAPRLLGALGAVGIAASFALVGHALGEPRLLLATLVAVHVLGVAYWIGAFAPLYRLAGLDDALATGRVAHRFGRNALWVVIALVIAGAALFVLMTGDPLAALATPYGRLFVTKLALVAVLLALAAYNKTLLTPALLSGDREAGTRLRRSIRFEAGVAVLILLTTAALTTLAAPE